MSAVQSDKEILRVIRQNRETGFRLLVNKYKESVYWHIRRITVIHSDAEDALQETFMRTFKNIEKLNDLTSLQSLIYKIATNKALRQKERRRKFSCSFEDAPTEVYGIMAEEYVDYSDIEAVRFQEAILSLPPKQQIAFNLRYYDELDYATIAEITDSTIGNVKSNYHIAKEKIICFINSKD